MKQNAMAVLCQCLETRGESTLTGGDSWWHATRGRSHALDDGVQLLPVQCRVDVACMSFWIVRGWQEKHWRVTGGHVVKHYNMLTGDMCHACL